MGDRVGLGVFGGADGVVGLVDVAVLGKAAVASVCALEPLGFEVVPAEAQRRGVAGGDGLGAEGGTGPGVGRVAGLVAVDDGVEAVSGQERLALDAGLGAGLGAGGAEEGLGAADGLLDAGDEVAVVLRGQRGDRASVAVGPVEGAGIDAGSADRAQEGAVGAGPVDEGRSCMD